MNYLTTMLLLLMAACCSCNAENDYLSEDVSYRRQVEVYDQQSKIAEAQLKRAGEQLDTADKLQKEAGAQLERSKELTDRFEQLLDSWENSVGER